MTNTINEKKKDEGKGRELPESVKLRIESCAYLVIDQATNLEYKSKSWVALNRIMQDNPGYTWIDSASAYVMRALKVYRAAGLARNYNEALNVFEARQVQDEAMMGNNQASIIGMNKLDKEVSRINRINNTGILYYKGIKGSSDFIPVKASDIEKPKKEESGRAYGRALGTLILEYDEKQANLDPAIIMDNENLRKMYVRHSDHLQRYFNEYTERLSNTRRKALYNIVQSDDDPNVLYSLKARNGDYGKEIMKLAWIAYRLYASLPDREKIDPIEWIGLLRQYIILPLSQVPYKIDKIAIKRKGKLVSYGKRIDNKTQVDIAIKKMIDNK